MADVNINLDPNSLAMQFRHVCRIKRLRQSMAMPRMHKHRESLQNEVDRRTSSLLFLGTKVPDDHIGLRDLIAEIESRLDRGEVA